MIKQRGNLRADYPSSLQASHTPSNLHQLAKRARLGNGLALLPKSFYMKLNSLLNKLQYFLACFSRGNAAR
jgi:hypothetical protein